MLQVRDGQSRATGGGGPRSFASATRIRALRGFEHAKVVVDCDAFLVRCEWQRGDVPREPRPKVVLSGFEQRAVLRVGVFSLRTGTSLLAAAGAALSKHG
jgi:hypothetical protein